MEKHSLEQLIQQSKLTEHSEKDFYSDVALKILLRTMTPVTVPATFEQSVLNKVALLEPTKLYKSFIAASSFYALITFLLFTFSSMVNSEISSINGDRFPKSTPSTMEIPKMNDENITEPIPSIPQEKQSISEELVSSKKKIVKRKNTNKTTQRPIPPPPKGIE